tara:strand:- start:247410 stop:248717 length:1308 start_codon:yes stop_codon:yes gene_type:complete
MISAQTISGKIIDKNTKKPIAFVAIYVPSLGLGTASLKNGAFTLNTEKAIKNKDILQFSIIGYKTQRLTLEQLKTQDYKVFLVNTYENLNEVVINANQKLMRSLPLKKLADLPQKTANTSSTIVNGKIHVFAGDKSFFEQPNRRIMEESTNFEDFLARMRMDVTLESYSDKLQIYDIAANSWTTSEQKFRKRAFHKAVKTNNAVYLLGGKRLNLNRTAEILDNTIEVFSTKENTLEVDNTNPHQAVNFAAVGYQNNIITMGGSTKVSKNGKKVYSDKAFVFNTKTGLWYRLPNMITPKETNGIVVNDKIYLIGGNRDGELTEIESFDLNSGKWTLEGDLFKGIPNAVLASFENTIFIYHPGKLLVFDTQTKLLQEYNVDFFLEGAELQYYNNKLYLFGGVYSDKLAYTRTSKKELFELDINDLFNTKVVRSKSLK